jgi:hypothetical protein
MLGIALVVALVGCGGGGSSVPSREAILQAQSRVGVMIEHSIDAKLEKKGRPTTEIDCVNRNIAAMTSRQIAERMVEAAPVEPLSKQSPAEIEGSLGKGCH